MTVMLHDYIVTKVSYSGLSKALYREVNSEINNEVNNRADKRVTALLASQFVALEDLAL